MKGELKPRARMRVGKDGIWAFIQPARSWQSLGVIERSKVLSHLERNKYGTQYENTRSYILGNGMFSGRAVRRAITPTLAEALAEVGDDTDA